jgi:hypothetical protein
MSGKHGYNAMSPSYGKRLPIQAYDGRFRTYSLASPNDTGAAMQTVKRLSLLLDLLLFAASLAGGGPIAAQIRILALVVAGIIGAVVIFTVAVLCIAALQQKQPPYDMGGSSWYSN